MTYIIWLNDFAILLENYFIDYFILIFLMIKMLQYKMYPAGELRCPTTALVGTLSLVFPFHCNVVLLFRENFVHFLCLFLSLKTLRTSVLFLLFMIEIPTSALLFQNSKPYFNPTFLIEGT